MARELVTLRISVSDYERYKAWAGIVGIPLSDGIGKLMDDAGFPTIEQLRAFAAPRMPLARSPLDGRRDENE